MVTIMHDHTNTLKCEQETKKACRCTLTPTVCLRENNLKRKRIDTHFNTLHQTLLQPKWLQLSNEFCSEVPHQNPSPAINKTA